MPLRFIGLAIAFFAFASCLAVSQSFGQEPMRKSVNTPTAREYLAAVFKRYGQMTTYWDAGQVRLITMENGKRVERVAPMRVAFGPTNFALQVYDVRAEAIRPQGAAESNLEFSAWFVDAETRQPSIKTLHGQVLVQRSAGAGLRDWLPRVFSDPVLSDRVAAGLAGPPPQLDWLLSKDPMAALFASKQTIEYDDRREVEGRACRTIEVRDQQAAYRFYIDERDYLIRRVDLPRVTIEPTPDQDPETIDLVIELKKARYNQRDLPTFWQEELHREQPREPRAVDRFVSPPPPEPPRHWGRTPKSYRVTDARGKEILSSRGGPVKATIVIPEVDSDSKQLAITLAQWVEGQGEDVRNQLRLVALRYEDREAAIALGMSPTSTKPADRIGIVNSKGVLIWSSPFVDPAVINSMTGVVIDTLAGVDVAERVRDQWEESTRRYQEVIGP